MTQNSVTVQETLKRFLNYKRNYKRFLNTTLLHNGEPTTNSNKRITLSRNHNDQRPQVAETN